jgi:integrase
MTWRKIAKGIYADDYSIQAIVDAGAAGRKTKRFPLDTDLADIKRWRNKGRVALDAAARRASRTSRRGAPRPGTLRGDLPTYLTLLAGNARLRNARDHQLRLWIRELGDRAHAPRHSLTPQELQAVLARWAKAGFAYWTIKHRRDALLALYTALDTDDEDVNPVGKTHVPLRKPEEEPRGLPLSVVHAILGAVSTQGGVIGKGDKKKPKGHRGGRRAQSAARIRIHVMAFTGMRPVELERYQPRDWRRETHELVIHGAKGSDERVVPLLEEAEPWLEQLQVAGAIGPFTRGSVERAFHRALVKVGLAVARPRRRRKPGPRSLASTPRPRTGLPTPYDLRHSFGTAAYEHTEDLSTVQQLLGHKDIRQTQRYAKNAVPKVLRAAMGKVGAAWKSVAGAG